MPDWGSTQNVSVVGTDYVEYALLYTEGTKGHGQDFRMATLYSMHPTLPVASRGAHQASGGGKAESSYTEARLLFPAQAVPRPLEPR